MTAVKEDHPRVRSVAMTVLKGDDFKMNTALSVMTAKRTTEPRSQDIGAIAAPLTTLLQMHPHHVQQPQLCHKVLPIKWNPDSLWLYAPPQTTLLHLLNQGRLGASAFYQQLKYNHYCTINVPAPSAHLSHLLKQGCLLPMPSTGIYNDHIPAHVQGKSRALVAKHPKVFEGQGHMRFVEHLCGQEAGAVYTEGLLRGNASPLFPTLATCQSGKWCSPASRFPTLGMGCGAALHQGLQP
eukprot:1136410-Pelagomonas_calceolata.AAC.3